LRYGPSPLSRVIFELPQNHKVVVQRGSLSPGLAWVRVKTVDPTTGRPARGWVEGATLYELAISLVPASALPWGLPNSTDTVIAPSTETLTRPPAEEVAQTRAGQSDPAVPGHPQPGALPADLSVLVDQVIVSPAQPRATSYAISRLTTASR